jgi:hypothetical protein
MGSFVKRAFAAGREPGPAIVYQAASVLTAVGGEVEILENAGSLCIRGCS